MHTGLPCVVNDYFAKSHNREVIVLWTRIFNWHGRCDAR